MMQVFISVAQKKSSSWTSDNGNGTYKNPLLWGDWSDPDIIRVGDEFYFIANSQLFQLIGNQGKIKNPEKLKETTILKIRLN